MVIGFVLTLRASNDNHRVKTMKWFGGDRGRNE